jgi:hypothetical protein
MRPRQLIHFFLNPKIARLPSYNLIRHFTRNQDAPLVPSLYNTNLVYLNIFPERDGCICRRTNGITTGCVYRCMREVYSLSDVDKVR